MAGQVSSTNSFPCDLPCPRKFKSAAALAQHKANAPRHIHGGQLPSGRPANGFANGLSNGSANGTHGMANGDRTGMTSELHGVQGVRIASPKSNKKAREARGMVAVVNGRNDAGQSSTQVQAPAAETRVARETKPNCTLCNKSFKTEKILANHVRYSPRHKNGAQATNGGRNQKGKQPQQMMVEVGNVMTKPKKKRNKKKNKNFQAVVQAVVTPLDRFFASYPDFPYDRAQPPVESFRQLERFCGMRKNSEEQNQAWESYQQALVDEIRLWYGNEKDLASWHQLCHAVGIRDPPPTMSQCEQELRQTHVNIVDLIEWGRNGQPTDHPVEVYGTILELSDYTFATNKIFPADKVRDDDGETNIVLRHLLRRLPRRGIGSRRGGVED
ncbi:hypothetical protein SBRCBS47491_002989 [Sporothrix bragantina]|uniref:C2H2-type domain-containing protein n=1 Tax=Sporothrix bragantina TaxID=671064 RepID=A0ABP0BBM6_9PEZI